MTFKSLSQLVLISASRASPSSKSPALPAVGTTFTRLLSGPFLKPQPEGSSQKKKYDHTKPSAGNALMVSHRSKEKEGEAIQWPAASCKFRLWPPSLPSLPSHCSIHSPPSRRPAPSSVPPPDAGAFPRPRSLLRALCLSLFHTSLCYVHLLV